MDPRKASAGENRVVPVEVKVSVPVDPKDPNKVLNVVHNSIQQFRMF